MRMARPAFASGGDLKSLGEQGIAGQHGDAFAKDFVAREFATAIIIVIHGGQIVMDEGVCMYALDGAGQWHGVSFVAPAGRRSGQAQSRPHPFSASEKGVPHGLVDRCRFRGSARQKMVKGLIDRHSSRFEKPAEIELVLELGAFTRGRHGPML